MIKTILIFIIGIIESLFYTWYLISVEKKQLMLSTSLMFIYMILYLGVVAVAIQSSETYLNLTVYALACAIGNFIVIYKEKRK